MKIFFSSFLNFKPLLLFFVLISSLLIQKIYAQDSTLVETKTKLESRSEINPYTIILYQPNYLMPFSYISSNEVAQDDIPDNDNLKHLETKFQFSIKAPVFKNIFNYRNSLNVAYTQLSFWQVYRHLPFFRETNYQPEIFFENILDKNIWAGWHVHALNIGYIHDSNGRGGIYERSWNRIYAEAVFSKGNWLINIRPWYVIKNNSLENNRDITKFLGYERVVIAYKFRKQTFALQTYNLEHINKSNYELTWSFPLIRQLRGYVQVFSGYGLNLIDYNHYANSMSVGIALNDWL